MTRPARRLRLNAVVALGASGTYLSGGALAEVSSARAQPAYFMASQCFIMSDFFMLSFSMPALCMQSALLPIFILSVFIGSVFMLSIFIVSDFMLSGLPMLSVLV